MNNFDEKALCSSEKNFGKVLRATGPMATANPFRFASKLYRELFCLNVGEFGRFCRCLVVLFCLFLSGCGGTRPSTYTEEEVRAFLSPGTSRAKVEKKFGRAPITLPSGEGREIAIYSFQMNDSGSFQERFTGFQVRYKDDHLEEWFPVYSHQAVQGGSEQVKPFVSPPNATGATN